MMDGINQGSDKNFNIGNMVYRVVVQITCSRINLCFSLRPESLHTARAVGGIDVLIRDIYERGQRAGRVQP